MYEIIKEIIPAIKNLILVYGLSTWLAFQQPRGGGKYRGDDNIYDIPALYKKIITGRGS